MPFSEHTVLAEQLYFYYSTPVRVPVFPNSRIPIRRIKFLKHEALKKIDFRLRANRVTALLGRNGSGKTTLIKLITGQRTPHGGRVQVFGQNPNLVRHRIGVCLGSLLIYNRLTARENLEYFGGLYAVKNLDRRIDELSDILSFRNNLDQMVETFSFGMKAKLSIARSLIHSPELLILDEPTLGIDIEVASHIRTFVRSLKCTVLLTTHYMEEAEQLADDLCFIEGGKITDQGTKQEVVAGYGASNVVDAFSRCIGQPDIGRAAS